MKLLPLILSLLACSDTSSPSSWIFTSDASSEASVDSVSCTPSLIRQDNINHCGACNHVCPSEDSNLCLQGRCLCGIDPQCPRGSDCRFNGCIASDSLGAICEFDHECERKYYCIEGHCTYIPCTPEECNGIDDDCDNKVDETAEDNPLSEFCFSGSPEQLLTPPCREGYRFCIQGEWSNCQTEIPPLEETGLLGCDKVDNDCNGCVDSIALDGVCQKRTTSNKFDVCFLIDTSGSMLEEQAALERAINSLVASWSPLDINFCIVLVPGAIDSELELFQDLTNTSEITTALTRLASLTFNTGEEPSYDAIYQIGTGIIPISWRTGSTRILLLFTDEEAQSFNPIYDPALMSSTLTTEELACNSLTHGESLAVVTEINFFPDWDNCAQTYELTEDSNTFTEDLVEVIQDPCQ